jgi:hypothetical protein
MRGGFLAIEILLIRNLNSSGSETLRFAFSSLPFLISLISFSALEKLPLTSP